jgi:hypothetical protein
MGGYLLYIYFVLPLFQTLPPLFFNTIPFEKFSVLEAPVLELSLPSRL